jgi:hypothetical protein
MNHLVGVSQRIKSRVSVWFGVHDFNLKAFSAEKFL